MDTPKAAIRHAGAPRGVPAVWGAGRLWFLASVVLAAAVSSMALRPAIGDAGQVGRVTGAQSPSKCLLPALIGLERSSAEGELEDSAAPACTRRLRRGHITIIDPHRRGPLRVVSQAPRARTPIDRRQPVNITLEAAPPLPRGCRAPAFYKVLVHTSRLIVWAIARAHHESATIETYYACTRPHGPKRIIAQAETEGDQSGSSIVQLTSAGVFVGLVEGFGSKDGSSETLAIHDVLSGNSFEIRVSDHPSGYSGSAEPQIQELAKLGSPVGEGANPFVLNTNGDIAWIGETEPSSTQPRQFVLYLHDHHQTREVATGPDISNLAFSGKSLQWRSAGVTHATPA
jgi:hypothetical protein